MKIFFRFIFLSFGLLASIYFYKLNLKKEESSQKLSSFETSVIAKVEQDENKENCSNSDLLGIWESIEDGGILEFKSNCQFIYDQCHSQGLYQTLKSQVTFETSTSQLNSDKCLPKGQTNCIYQVSSLDQNKILDIKCPEFSKRYSYKVENKNESLPNEINVKITNEKSFSETNVDINKVEEVIEEEREVSDEKNINSKNTILKDCDGIYRKGVTSCYYKNLPSIVLSGGSYGQVFWSSKNLDPKKFDMQFKAKRKFQIRFFTRPGMVSKSTFSKECNLDAFKADGVRLKFNLKSVDESYHESAILTSSLNKASSVKRFRIPHTSGDKYILEILNVETNSYCKKEDCPKNSFRRMASSFEKIAPECVKIEVQFSTEKTYDLPK